MRRGWRWWNRVVETMTGRCKRRRKAMAGDRNTADTKKIDNPNSNPQITENPSGFSKIAKLPPTSTFELDFYCQAHKTLSFRSPFDSEESLPLAVSVLGANILPSRVSRILGRHSDGRKRQKKSYPGSEKKSASAGKPGRYNIWFETDEYFRELTVEDVAQLERVSSVGFSGNASCFLIPSFGNDDSSCGRYNALNRSLKRACEKDSLILGNEIVLSNGEQDEVKEMMIVQEENGPTSMDVDGDEGMLTEIAGKGESNGVKRENSEKDLTYINGVEWLLGSRSKIYLASERPSKKRKLLGRDAGLEKLLVASSVEGLDSVCHYCSSGDMGDPLNCLIKCASCGVMVHRRCYGVTEDVDSSWLCSWCEGKSGESSIAARPCWLCPKSGGALKPVEKSAVYSDDEGYEVKFAHLFCCQWMPEVYLENTRTMEPIMNIDEVNDTRTKMICYLCKVNWGACVRCSNGACRTSFHPICAREARHRMEIWGKFGCDEVELRAFCSKHSRVQYDRRNRKAVTSMNDHASHINKQIELIDDDGGDLVDSRSSSESHSENGDALQPSNKKAMDKNGTENSSPNFTMILKKLIDLGKADVKDVASEIGVSLDSMSVILTDNHVAPELQYKVLEWLKNHAHIGGLQKSLKVSIRSLAASKAEAADLEESDVLDAVPIKSVPPRRRTKGNIRIVKDDEKANNETTIDDFCPAGGVDSNGVCIESQSDVTEKMLIDPEQHIDGSVNYSLRTEATDEMSKSLAGEGKQSEHATARSPVLLNDEVVRTSYIHPFIYSKLMQEKNCALGDTESYPSSGVRQDSHLEASTSSGPCCNNYNWISKCEGVNLDQLVKEGNLDMLKLSPSDEIEGELIYYQHRILTNAIQRKHITDDLISKVAKSLPEEIDAAGREKWNAVLVSQYNSELREAKKKGRKERRHKEAQAILAAATAAAAASSRLSTRKDALDESANQEDPLKLNVKLGVYSQQNPRVKNTISRSTNVPKDQPRICEICARSETILNPVLVCSSCKVSVHLDCYLSVKSTTGTWHCELCEDLLFSSQVSESLPTEKPYFVAECGLCGGTASAFRKSVDGQWIHALCAEWVLESKYRRGQVNPIEGIDSVSHGNDTCSVCCRKQGVCLKCSYGHCQSTFHPTCGRSAGFYMTVRTSGGKLQHKAYCEKHSSEQRAKADTQKHGIEEFKSVKQVRVELERLRLLCERIIKREKLKRELLLCSHDILASNRDSVLSALARHPFYQPEISSESATTSIKACSHQSGSETVQRSDDTTIDSTVAGKRRVKFPVSMDNGHKTVDSSTSRNLYTLKKPKERVSLSGKQIQKPSVAPLNLSEDMETRSKHKKTETLEKELVMTSDQASMKNQRLPKGYVYVPIRSLSKDKVPDTSGM